MSVEHYAATLVSHELAHKWFGNLITCFWWSNTWINEGFASYFGYIAAHAVSIKSSSKYYFNAVKSECSIYTQFKVSEIYISQVFILQSLSISFRDKNYVKYFSLNRVFSINPQVVLGTTSLYFVYGSLKFHTT